MINGFQQISARVVSCLFYKIFCETFLLKDSAKNKQTNKQTNKQKKLVNAGTDKHATKPIITYQQQEREVFLAPHTPSHRTCAPMECPLENKYKTLHSHHTPLPCALFPLNSSTSQTLGKKTSCICHVAFST